MTSKPKPKHDWKELQNFLLFGKKPKEEKKSEKTNSSIKTRGKKVKKNPDTMIREFEREEKVLKQFTDSVKKHFLLVYKLNIVTADSPLLANLLGKLSVFRRLKDLYIIYRALDEIFGREEYRKEAQKVLKLKRIFYKFVKEVQTTVKKLEDERDTLKKERDTAKRNCDELLSVIRHGRRY